MVHARCRGGGGDAARGWEALGAGRGSAAGGGAAGWGGGAVSGVACVRGGGCRAGGGWAWGGGWVGGIWRRARLWGVAVVSVAGHFVMVRAEFLAAMPTWGCVGGVLVRITFAGVLVREQGADTEVVGR